jgi:hypothetical protein
MDKDTIEAVINYIDFEIDLINKLQDSGQTSMNEDMGLSHQIDALKKVRQKMIEYK